MAKPDWDRARYRDRRRDGKPDKPLGAMTDRRRAFLEAQRRRLKAAASKPAPPR